MTNDQGINLVTLVSPVFEYLGIGSLGIKHMFCDATHSKTYSYDVLNSKKGGAF